MRSSSRQLSIRLLVSGALLVGSAAGAVAQSSSTESEARSEEGVSQGTVTTGDRTVRAGESVAEIVVIGGTLQVAGQVRGDAVVVGGDLVLQESGVIEGDALVTGGRLIEQGGRVLGEIRTLDGRGSYAEQVERALSGRSEGRTSASSDRERARSERHAARARFWSDPIRRGFAGIISTVAFGIVLAGIGGALIFFGRSHLETVSDTVRSATLRSAATGLAATFLMIPAFVVLIVALAVSIIGIPLLLIAVPLYPLAIFAGSIFGLVGVAHAMGERTAEQSRDALDLRYGNAYAHLFTGLAILLAPLLAAHLLQMTGFLGVIGILLKIATWAVIWLASTVGFGAVILSRAGTRRTFVTPPADAGFDDLFSDTPFDADDHA